MIALTERAAEKIREFAADEGLVVSVRAKVIGSGCAGLSNDLTFDDLATDADESFDSHGCRVIVDQLSLQYLDGCEIDYREGPFESGFVFANPNVTSSCGCGSSYSVG